MTFEELRERIKEKVILEKGEIGHYQWEQWNIRSAASEIGILDSQFFILVREVTNTVSFRVIEEVEEAIVLHAPQWKKQISTKDEEKIAAKAAKLAVSRAFLVDHWIPKVLQGLPEVEGTGPQALTVLLPSNGYVTVYEQGTGSSEPDPSVEEPTTTTGPSSPPSLFNPYRKYQFGILIVVVVCVAGFYLYRGSGIRHSQEEMEKILEDGINLVDDKGLHKDADLKFETVRQMYLGDQRLDTALIGQAIIKFKSDGDRFCSSTKDSTIISIANEYYKHASILSNRQQIICK
ncbi:hypothetical protein [Dyadobacter bucti]|uniref:hypothetical protein n=1 Tax=Dyadobacter bucti TaxID=2572203 RepID=UPI00110833BB|nr:hypothetical protein [Dyadobacter bucti]